MSDIPKEYQIECKGCGKILDMRNPNIMAHGWRENGKIVCYDGEPITYASSMEKGGDVQWTAEKQPLHLN